MIEVNNFLPQDEFDKLKTLITKEEFPWYHIQSMVVDKKDNLGYFTHSFYNNNSVSIIISMIILFLSMRMQFSSLFPFFSSYDLLLFVFSFIASMCMS